MSGLIPERIIQTGKSIDLPLPNRVSVASLTSLNPTFDYRFFDDAAVTAFISTEFPQYRDVFESFRFRIQRFDFFRYLAVYRFGGFYFDLDFFLGSGLSPLLETGCVFPYEGLTFSRYLRDTHNMDWHIGNYAFGAAPGHPFIAAVIENCLRAQQDPSWAEPMMRGTPRLSRAEFTVLNTTGPGLISRTFSENKSLADTVTVLFPDDPCDMRNWNRFGDFGVHLMDGTWRGSGRSMRRRIAQLLEGRVAGRRLSESLRLGKTRRVPPRILGMRT